MKTEKNTIKEYISTDILDRKWIDVNIPCRTACPIMTDIPGYIQAIMEGDYETAYRINRLDNVLPGILGRVCNRPCEPVCRHGWDGLGDPVSICFLKRSASDFGFKSLKLKGKYNGKTVCIIGAGPAGLTAANDLALKGYKVTVLEQFDQPGGMLRYGIPQFRLPYEIVALDVKSITDLGVRIRTNTRIESQEDIEKLKNDFDAVLMAGGCMLPRSVNIKGIENIGVLWGLDFMITANKEELDVPMDKVVVIGGGFTAVDCTRMAYRLGAKHITLAYRRTKDDMYVTTHELEAMEAEGIHLSFLVSPVEVEIDKERIKGVRFIRNAIKKDRSIKPITGSEFFLEADTVVFAIGQEAEEDMLTKDNAKIKDNLFVGGDFRNGSSTVIEAAADGRKIAQGIHKLLSGKKTITEIVRIEEIKNTGRERSYDFIPRQPMEETPLFERTIKNKEVELGFSMEKSLIEARRCYLCHFNFQIDLKRCIYCLACMDVMPVNCIMMAKDIQVTESGDLTYVETKNWEEVIAIAIDNNQCIRCGNCVRACPVDCISISKYQKEAIE